ncbi:pyridoxal-5'-phosphate-dependent protein subunit beta (plasmid) [Aminobacter sp. Y103A]|uniref:Pyridoxal-5'-phosphate-dependent protein subunit beta n=1 Tax=Aminobacter aminovorans TaxID=83263 RepID=A0AAC9AT21_AMIAI|nr:MULTISPECIES: pyridoxal-phosphate dependent enzyme [Aminobacter]AMS44640.1 pyridoxal-5'-phosphate-dependent protein subunit beta [Aminobacter aminovorans]MBB3708415.1 threonine dehydratase [Aminobacter aminovorans]WMD00289.1 pyridoxal-phosphate dependent enzyme [Aminobacter niigataensis]BBD40781.1 pyridoxal-5'-phosphate-dependent protein subunit beta [Aminobacter sp. SS-2016]
MTAPYRPSLDEIAAARTRIAPYVPRTPLVRLDLGLPDRQIFLKLETLSSIGAFKLRPALNALLSRNREALTNGVATTSSGNMAYGMAWAANRLGVPMAAYMYSGAPQTKIDGVRRLGGEVRFISMETWWQYIIGADRPEFPELLINPVTDQAVLSGNGSIGMEIVEDLPEVDVVLTPYGGGSMTTGVASAVKALRPEAKVFAVEDENAAPVTAALAAGRIVDIETRPSFIKSIGGPSLVPQLWPVARELIDGAVSVSLMQVTEAMRLLFAKSKVVAEGAGAASLAAALTSQHARGNIVCVISGGNIDAAAYSAVLAGNIPAP